MKTSFISEKVVRLSSVLILSLCVFACVPATLTRQVGYGDIDSVKMFIQTGGDVNHHDEQGGYTLLMNAVFYNQIAIAKYLLEKGAAVDMTGDDGRTALIIGADFNTIPILELLFKYNPNVNIQARDGSTALIVAAQKNNVQAVKLLLAHDADPGIADNTGRTALSYATDRYYMEAPAVAADEIRMAISGALGK